MDSVISKVAEQEHDTWALDMFGKGWSYGAAYNEKAHQHPMLKPYRTFNDRVSIAFVVFDRNMY